MVRKLLKQEKELIEQTADQKRKRTELAERQKLLKNNTDEVRRTLQQQAAKLATRNLTNEKELNEPVKKADLNLADGAAQMELAAEKLESETNEDQPARQNARENQQRAVEYLQNALQQLESAEDALRKEWLAKTREAIEEQLSRIREKQAHILQQTKKIDEDMQADVPMSATLLPADEDESQPAPTREERLMMRKLADSQEQGREDLDDVRNKFREAQALDWVVSDTVDNMQKSATRLRRDDPGMRTQEIQAEALENLDDLLASLKKSPSEDPQFADQLSAAGAAGQGGGVSMPSSMQLKLLKKIQERINRKTRRFDKIFERKPSPAEEDLAALYRVAEKQRDIRDVTAVITQREIPKVSPIFVEEEKSEKVDSPPEKIPSPEEEERNIRTKTEEIELMGDLLGSGDEERLEKPDHVNVMLVRMERSRQRLGKIYDPGKITQEIQRRILDDFDSIISQAQSSEKSTSQMVSTPTKGEPSSPDRQASQQKGEPLKDSRATATRPEDLTAADERARLDELEKQWGNLPPKTREAIIQGFREEPLPEYRELVEAYYKAVSDKATQQR
jgi:hypothetical protein